MWSAGRLSVLSSALVVACTSSGEPPTGSGGSGAGCGFDFLGDTSAAVKLEIELRGADGTSSSAADGGPAPMIEPLQGGRVIFAGVRATNLDPCAVEISGSLRDPTTNQVRVDVRTTILRPTGDGWGASSDTDTSSFANIPVCPNQWASTDLYGHPFELEVSVTDSAGRTASEKLDVEPVCAEPAKAADCTCQCKQGYQLGQPCN